jgi:hypothetical protein
MNGWGFVDDNNTGTGGGQMRFGPPGQPLGVGSAELTLTSKHNAAGQYLDGWALATGNHNTTKVTSILSLYYSTYTASPNTNAIALQLAVSNTLPTGYHRLVYEPTNNGSVVSNHWQRWNPTDPAARWWMTPRDNPVCPQSNPCLWSQIKILFPNATITGGIWFKAGSNWSPGTYDVDAFLFVATLPLRGTLYDFEPDRNNGDPD